MKIQRQFSGRTILTMTFAFCMAVICGFIATQNMKTTSAATTQGFNAGNIISDAVMGNYNSMTLSDIQRFLTSKNPCNNRDHNRYQQLERDNPKYDWHWKDGHFVCLSEERFGDGQQIGSGQTAAEIIYQAAQDYKINPQVLLVVLQKETSLVTDPIPNNGDYRKAMGFACSDSAPCEAKYYGFKNQIRAAANLFHEVLSGGWSNYPVGKTVYVQYNPNKACGGSNVYIANKATSALYRYTPYQPNQSALNAGYGLGDGCGAYGNRNLYLYFNEWFGSTQVYIEGSEVHLPDGVYSLTSAAKGNGALDLSGDSSNDGTNIGIWDYHGRNNQKWEIKRESDGYYSLKNPTNGKYLDLNGAIAQNGRNIALWGKTDSCAQRWKIYQTPDNYLTFESACMSGMVMDVFGGEASKGANVGVWIAHNKPNQKWTLRTNRTVKDGLYTIQTSLSDQKSLDIHGAARNNGANISLWDKNSGVAQRWYVQFNASGDFYTLRNPYSGKLLDLNAAQVANGNKVQLWDKNDTCAQRWKIIQNNDKTYSLLSTCRVDFAIDVSNSSTANNTKIALWEYNGAKNQRWKFAVAPQLISNGTYSVVSRLSEQYAVDITGGHNKDGTNIEIWDHKKSTNQQWKISYNAYNDDYVFTNPATNKVLDLNGGKANNNKNIALWSKNVSCAQRWHLNESGKNYYRIVSTCDPSYVVDVSNGIMRNGTNILLWEDKNSFNQQWKFIKY